MEALLKFEAGPFTEAMSALSGRDLTIASIWALNDTLDDVLPHVSDRMAVVFDRPNNFTRNAFRPVKARQGHPEAAVEQRRDPLRHYLRVEEEGGPRGQTGIEKLISLGIVRDEAIQAIIPDDGAKLDPFGNWSKGERTQVLSQLKVQRDKTANETEASRKRKRRRARYFVPVKGLAPGVYRRDEPGGAAFRVLKFTAKVPVYQQRLGFYEAVAEVYAARMPQHLRRTLGQMIRKRFG